MLNQAAWILMPSNESHEHTPSHIHTSEAVDQHGRVGIQTTHADDTGTGGNEMPSNNPGRKNEGGEQFEPDEDTSQGGEDEGGPSKQDVMDSLKRSEVGWRLFGGAEGGSSG